MDEVQFSNCNYDFFRNGTGNGSGAFRNIHTFRFTDIPLFAAKMKITGFNHFLVASAGKDMRPFGIE
jgi:hypothetical protein